MSEDNNKKLDNTEISDKDVKELETGKDTKLDESPSSTKKKSSSSRSNKNNKSKKDTSYTDVSDQSAAHEATVPKDAGNVHETSLRNIKGKLSDPKIQQEFVINVADLIGQYSRRKLTQTEVHILQDVVSRNLLQKVFQIQKI
jgi:hypothetical protein